MTATRTTIFWLVLWATLVFISALLVSYAPYPFVFVLLLWLCGFFYAAKQTHSIRRAICINLAAVVGLFLVLEAHWVNKKVFRAKPVINIERADGSSEKDPIVGRRLTANFSAVSTRTANDQLSYSVTYTTDSGGRRITPEPVGQSDKQCLVFLGCSFTFGDGVEDSESMPFQVSQKLNRKAFNLGVSGFGPHQMLATIEFDLLPPEIGSCSSKVAVYQAIPDHVKRSAGLGQYGTFGPKYVLTADNNVEYVGQFDDVANDQPTNSVWVKLFAKSFIYQEYAIDRDWIGDYEVELYLAVVKAARDKIKLKYPDIKFVILYWDTSPRTYAKTLDERLPELADEYIRVTDIISDINDNKPAWYLNYDPHPNARAHQQVADYLAVRLAD